MDPVTDPVGARTYSPSEEACRKAPAFVCAVASRVQRLRQKLVELNKEQATTPEPMRFTLPQLEKMMAEFTGPVPFEKELLSSDIAQVNAAFERADSGVPVSGLEADAG